MTWTLVGQITLLMFTAGYVIEEIIKAWRRKP
jgi:lipid-A-disaccharide synthase-like uncharacterized protein